MTSIRESFEQSAKEMGYEDLSRVGESYNDDEVVTLWVGWCAALEAAGEPPEESDEEFARQIEEMDHPTERAGEAVQRAADEDRARVEAMEKWWSGEGIKRPFNIDGAFAAGWGCHAAHIAARALEAMAENARELGLNYDPTAASGNTATARSDETTTGAGVRGEPKQPEPLQAMADDAHRLGLYDDVYPTERAGVIERLVGLVRAVESLNYDVTDEALRKQIADILATHPQGSGEQC